MNNGFDFYRLKTIWEGEAADGNMTKKKTEELIYASNYSEAEQIAHALIADQDRMKFSDGLTYEIIKTKINELLYNDTLVKEDHLIGGRICCYFSESEETGVGLYGVKVIFISIDERTGKEKRSKETIYTPATSNADATLRVKNHLASSMSDFVIRDTKFDKAEAILWPTNVYQNIVNKQEA